MSSAAKILFFLYAWPNRQLWKLMWVLRAEQRPQIPHLHWNEILSILILVLAIRLYFPILVKLSAGPSGYRFDSRGGYICIFFVGLRIYALRWVLTEEGKLFVVNSFGNQTKKIKQLIMPTWLRYISISISLSIIVLMQYKFIFSFDMIFSIFQF